MGKTLCKGKLTQDCARVAYRAHSSSSLCVPPMEVIVRLGTLTTEWQWLLIMMVVC